MDALYSYWEPASLNTSGNQRNEAQGIPAGRDTSYAVWRELIFFDCLNTILAILNI
jgi:hypothetical protein